MHSMLTQLPQELVSYLGVFGCIQVSYCADTECVLVQAARVTAYEASFESCSVLPGMTQGPRYNSLLQYIRYSPESVMALGD